MYTCAGCGEKFNSEIAFNKHRTGEYENPTKPRRCRSVDEMLARGMVRNERGRWITVPKPEPIA